MEFQYRILGSFMVLNKNRFVQQQNTKINTMIRDISIVNLPSI